MTEASLFPPPAEFAKHALIDDKTYHEWYAARSTTPTASGPSTASAIDWIKPFTKVKNTSFTGDVSIKWFEDGTLNVGGNCLDRHLAKRGDQTAIIWEGDDPDRVASTSPTASCTSRSAAWPMR